MAILAPGGFTLDSDEHEKETKMRITDREEPARSHGSDAKDPQYAAASPSTSANNVTPVP